MNAPYAAVVLAGGTGRRLGGRDKPALELAGRRLLDRVLDAVGDAGQRIVVGPEMPVPPGVTIVRERPAGGGPVAALAAALEVVTVDRTLLLAADLPFLSAEVVAALLRAAGGRDGAMLVDDGGRDQLLLGAWSTAALRVALAGVPIVEGAALRPLLSRLDAARVPWQVSVGTPPPWWDCDSVEDLRQARVWADLPLTEGEP